MREIPVHLHFTPGSDVKLCVLQFPLRAANNTMPDVSNVKLRPRVMHLELATALDSRAGTFDADKPTLPRVKEMVHTSSAVPCCTSSAVGNFKDGVLHLVPVYTVMQMRPTYRYLDADAAEKAAAEEGSGAGAGAGAGGAGGGSGAAVSAAAAAAAATGAPVRIQTHFMRRSIKRAVTSAAASRVASRAELEAMKASDDFVTLALSEETSEVFDGALAR